MRFAQRLSRLGTETAFEVLARAQALEAQGKRVIHLEIGEPDFDTPKHIRKAAADAMEAGFTHYGPSAGLPEFRRLIAEQWSRDRGIPCDADSVVVTPGGKPIMFFAMLALLEEGDEVLYPNPGFPIYESVINFVGGVPVPIPLREETGFGFDLDEFERRIDVPNVADVQDDAALREALEAVRFDGDVVDTNTKRRGSVLSSFVGDDRRRDRFDDAPPHAR